MLLTFDASAQSPQLINYQAVARHTDTGSEISNQSIFLTAKILSNGPNGDIVYQENHAETATNTFGLFNIQIGGGEPVSGSFDQIDWSTGTHWLEIDLDIGSGLETVGSMQFVSVPYALHAGTVDNADDADADPSNELISDFSFDPDLGSLSITENGQLSTVDLSTLAEDADSDPTNELIDLFSFDEETSTLSIADAGQTYPVDLSSLINDADTNPGNELITSLTYSPDENVLTITESNGEFTYSTNLSDLAEDDDADPENEVISSVMLQGSTLVIDELDTWSVNMSQLIDDADADPANELIADDGLVLHDDTMLQITEGGTLHELNLASLRNDADWTVSSDETMVYNTTANVGIGTSNPTTKFQVNGSVGYGISLIQSGGIALSYSVSDVDHIIVCKINPGSMPIEIQMPDPADCEGRIITVRRTGPVPINAQVNIEFGGAELDYLPQSISLVDAGRGETVSFLSLGADGWTKIMAD